MSCKKPGGSLIDVQSQVLGEKVGITGTPFDLHYSSDRVRGRVTANVIKIPLSLADVPKGLKSIELKISIGERDFTYTFPPKPNQSYTFTWNGNDLKGRALQGVQPVKISVRYHEASGPPTLWQDGTYALGAWDGRTQGLGGWSLNVHHVYDPIGKRVFLGDGGRLINPSGDPLARSRLASAGEITIPAQDGRQVYVFTSAGRHLRTLSALTGSLIYRFTYGAAGRLSAIEDSNGNTTQIQRDPQGNPVAIIAPYGQRTALSLNAGGYISATTNQAGVSTRFTYSAEGSLATFTDPNGSVYRFSYDRLGRLLKDEDPAGGYFALALISSGESSLKHSLKTALGRESTFLLERLSTGEERRKTIDPSGIQTALNIDKDGSRTITFPTGMMLTSVQQPDPRWGMQSPLLKSSVLTTPGGIKSNLAANRTVTLAQGDDPLSLATLTDTLRINERQYTRTFDVAQKQTTVRTPTGRTTVIVGDADGRATKVQIGDQLQLDLSYDQRGRLTTVTHGSGGDARITSVAYDAEGRIGGITDPLKRTVRFEYDPFGRVVKQTLADGREIRYTYDASGNTISITPAGRPAHVFGYTPVNFLKEYTPPKRGHGAVNWVLGRVSSGAAGAEPTKFSYNAGRQLTHVKRPDGTAIELAYDKGGRPTGITFPGSRMNIAYDAKSGNLSKITDAAGGNISYSYDGSLLTEVSWGGVVSGRIKRTYDNNVRIVAMEVNGSKSVNFNYDPDGLLTRAGALTLKRDPQNGFVTETVLGSLATTQEYNGFGELTNYQAGFGNKAIYEVRYTRDVLGRIVKKTETVEGLTNRFIYTYDLAERLSDVSKNDVKIAHFEYDANGNRLAYKGVKDGQTGRYDEQDRLIQYGDSAYAHTANGEWLRKTTNGKSTTYNYVAFGGLRGVSLPDGTKVEYIIDGRNRRIGKKVNGQLVQGFLYQDQLTPLVELDGKNNVISRFVYATKVNVPEYMEKAGKVYRIITDHLGSPRLVIDISTGEIAQRMDYDEFGYVLQDTNPGFQPFGFTGGLYDQHTKLTRLGARDYDALTGRWTVKELALFGVRDYDPETGRWTTKDRASITSKDLNLYTYVRNDPLNLVDFNGLAPAKPTWGERVLTAAQAVWDWATGVVLDPVTAPVIGEVTPLLSEEGAHGAAGTIQSGQGDYTMRGLADRPEEFYRRRHQSLQDQIDECNRKK